MKPENIGKGTAARQAVGVIIIIAAIFMVFWQFVIVDLFVDESIPDGNNVIDSLKIDIDLGPQIINSVLQQHAYPSIQVEMNRPVRWIIDALPENINNCNDRFVIPEYDIEHQFTPGENIIEFTPTGEGQVTFTCHKGIITGTITVVRGTRKNAVGKTVPRCC